MNRVLLQVEKAVNAEITQYNALQYQTNYLKSKLNIQNLKPATGFLRQKQRESLALAKTIQETLKKQDIYPMLSGHSLLGAVRHKGFIPWESNMQFALMAQDFWRIEDCIKEEIKLGNENNFQLIDSKHTKKKITNSPLNYEKKILEKNILEQEKNALHKKNTNTLKSQEDELIERILQMELEIEAAALNNFQYDPFDYLTTLNDAMQKYALDNKQLTKLPIFLMRTPFSIGFYQGESLENAVRVEFVPYYYLNNEAQKKKLETQAQVIKELIHKSITYGMVFHFYDELIEDIISIEQGDNIYAGINNNEFIRKNLNFQNKDTLRETNLLLRHEVPSPHFFEISDFFPLKTINFEGHLFDTYNKEDSYLTALYGNYHQLPKYIGISPYYVNLNVWLRDNRRRLLTISEATLIA